LPAFRATAPRCDLRAVQQPRPRAR
jgi:hypothetical protein